MVTRYECALNRVQRGTAVVAAALAFFACGKATRNDNDTANRGGRAGAAGSTARGGATAGQGNDGGGGNSSAGVGGSDVPVDCGVAPSSQIPRLTSAQYERTIRDLLGVTEIQAFGGKRASEVLPPDHAGELTEPDWAAYLALASSIAAEVMADAMLRSHFMACAPVGDGSACLRETISRFGRRAFRRPLFDYEIARFESIVTEGAQITATGAPNEIAEVLLETFLASPSFIQRAEISPKSDGDGRFRLDSHEIASRLSYALWGSTPDEVLDRAADAGELATNDQIRVQAERMLADPRARELVAAFHRAYLELGVERPWLGVEKDPTRFPEFTAAVAVGAREETERFFDAIVFEQGGSFADLFKSPLAFVNASTAPLYGLDASAFGATLQAVTLDATERPGFLTRVGFLSAYSYSDRTSPSDRGAFILQQVLGSRVPPHPPPHVPLSATPGFATNRERVAAVASAPTCAACHGLIDPFGFALEAYDAIGRWQTAEADSGSPIDSSADVRIDEEEFLAQNPQELMLRLAASQSARRAYATRWISWVYERELQPADACDVDALGANLGGEGYRLLDLLVDLTQTDSFRTRTVELTP